MLLRQELHRRGLRFRVDRPVDALGSRRRVDVVFTRAKVAVFVDGCFWHRCPRHATWPATNTPWWSEKLAKNVERDRDSDRRLRAGGWVVVRAWEHESAKAVADVVELVVRRRSR
jgi:DNA mismatch endonuclease (patch repair protein)